MDKRTSLFRSSAIACVVCCGLASTAANDRKAAPRIADLAWLAGHWHTKVDNGELDEVWSPPAGDCMMGVFRWLRGGGVWIYEILTIREENGTLMFRFRHFGHDLTAWEPKTEPLTFKLAQLDETGAVFHNVAGHHPDRFIFRREDPKTLVVRLEKDTEDGVETTEFRYRRR